MRSVIARIERLHSIGTTLGLALIVTYWRYLGCRCFGFPAPATCMANERLNYLASVAPSNSLS